jgi:hypothetical protein
VVLKVYCDGGEESLTVVRGTDWRCFLQNWGSTTPCSEQTCVGIPEVDPSKCDICEKFDVQGDDGKCFFDVWNSPMRDESCDVQLCVLKGFAEECTKDFQCIDDNAYCARDVTGMYKVGTGDYLGDLPGHCCPRGQYWNGRECDRSDVGDLCNCDVPPSSRAFYTTKAHACILGERVCTRAATVGLTDDLAREVRVIFGGSRN